MDNPQFQERLKALRQSYLAQLPEKMWQIRQIWDTRAEGNAADQLAEMRRQVHNLAGSGATFGCQSVGEAARHLELLLNDILAETEPVSDSQGKQIAVDLDKLDVAVGQCCAKPEANAGKPLPQLERRAQPRSPVVTPKERVLFLVDDDAEFAQQFVGRLAQHDYQVQVFVDFEALADALKIVTPIALVMDMVLPSGELGGVEIVQKLHEQAGKVMPVIFLSVRGDFEARLAATRAGVTHYLTKPLDVPRLLQILEDYFGSDQANPYRVLVADDDAPLADMYRMYLEEAGLSVAVIHDPLAVMDKLRQFEPDLVLMDINMPHCNGLELAAVIRQFEDFDQVPIVFLTAEGNTNNKLAAMNLGGDEFLTKPVLPWHLVSAIMARIKRARSLRHGALGVQRALHELEEFKRALDEHDIVSMADASGNITYVNDKFCEISGYSRAELLGQNHRIVKSDAHSPAFYEQMWSVIESGQVWHGELKNRKKYGGHYWVESTIVPFLDDFGVPQRYISLRTDITRIKDAEEVSARQKSLLEVLRQATSQFVESARPDEVAGYLLDSLIELTQSEYGFMGEVLYDEAGQPYLRTYAVTNIAWSEETRRLCEAQGGKGMEFRNLKTLFGAVMVTGQPVIANDPATDPRSGGLPKGHPAMNAFLGAPIFHGDQMVGMYGIANRQGGYDEMLLEFLQPFNTTCGVLIQAKRTMEEKAGFQNELVSAKEEAERANRAKSDFLSSMSHELRTPMNAVLGFGQLLESDTDEPLTESQAENVGQILHAGWHLLELINEVLDLAKVESGKIDLSIENVDPLEVLRECVDLIGSVAAGSGIQVSLDISSDKLHMVRADRTRLKQALLNLISNAIKYNRENGLVTISARYTSDAKLRLCVTDTGVGLSEQQLQRLFQPFNRLGAERSGIEGTGIGLVITRQLVQLMGGSIGVESEPGQGSTFWIELGAVDERAGLSESGMSETPELHGIAMRTVLYVEDNPANLRLVAQVLGRLHNIKLLSAHTGELGLDLARSNSPDLIILDINLPGMDGFEIRARLRLHAQSRHIPVIALSANAMPRDIERGLEAGFARYLTKPLKVAEFMKALNELMPENAG